MDELYIGKKAKFEPGDVVVLKSGGPAMTVRGTDSPWADNRIRVTTNWFDEEDKLHQDGFVEDTLELVDDPEEKAKDELLKSIPILMNFVSLAWNGQDIIVPAAEATPEYNVERWLDTRFPGWRKEEPKGIIDLFQEGESR